MVSTAARAAATETGGHDYGGEYELSPGFQALCLALELGLSVGVDACEVCSDGLEASEGCSDGK